MNMERFKRIMDHIRANPLEYRQASWHGRTAHCIGGWAHIFKLMDERNLSMCDADVLARQQDYEGPPFSMDEGMKWLQIQADYPFIFYPDTSLKDLEAVERGERNAITGEEIRHEVP
jgi:hypothetical protein